MGRTADARRSRIVEVCTLTTPFPQLPLRVLLKCDHTGPPPRTESAAAGAAGPPPETPAAGLPPV